MAWACFTRRTHNLSHWLAPSLLALLVFSSMIHAGVDGKVTVAAGQFLSVQVVAEKREEKTNQGLELEPLNKKEPEALQLDKPVSTLP